LSDEDRIEKRSDRNVGSRVMRGAALMSGARVSVRVFSLLNLVVLARLLHPHDYGIAALALSTISLLTAATDIRVTTAIIAFKELTNKHLDTGFTITLLRGLLMAAVLLLFAEVFADFSRSPELADPLRVLSVVPIIEGLRNPRFALFQRNIEFGQEFARTVAGAAAGSIMSIVIAFWMPSYWAIIWGTIAQRVIATAVTYLGVDGRAGLSLRYWREFVRFGGWLTLATILATVRGNFGPSFLFGRYLGTAAVGLFSIALTVSQLVTRELVMPLAQALAPGFATIAHDPPRLRLALRDAQASMIGIVIPVGVATAVLARDMIVLVSGPKWEAAAPIVQILAPVFALSVVNAGLGALIQATGNTRQAFNRNILIFVLTMPVLWVASAYGDLTDAVWAVAFGSLVETVLSLRLAARIVGSPSLEAVTASWRPFLAGGVMAGVLALTGNSGETAPLPLALALAPRLLLGFVVYLVADYVLWRLAGRPTGFETKMMDMAGPRLPAALRPAFRKLRGR